MRRKYWFRVFFKQLNVYVLPLFIPRLGQCNFIPLWILIAYLLMNGHGAS